MSIFLLELIAKRTGFISSEISLEVFSLSGMYSRGYMFLYYRFPPGDYIYTGTFLCWVVVTLGAFLHWGAPP